MMRAYPVFEWSLETVLDDITLNYRLEVDDRGYIHTVVLDFLELPEDLQQMILRDEEGSLVQRARQRGSIFQHELMLALAKQLEDEDKPINALAQHIHQRLQQEGKAWASLPVDEQTPSMLVWWRTCLGLTDYPLADRVKEKLIPALRALVLIEHYSQKSPSEAIAHLGKFGGIGGQNLLIDLLPFLSGGMKRQALACLKDLPRASIKCVLLAHLAMPLDETSAYGVFEALEAHRGTDIAPATHRFYQHHHHQLSVDTLYPMVRVLKSYPGPVTTRILLAILKRFEGVVAREAGRTLLAQGYPQSALVAGIQPGLYSDDWPKRQRALDVLLLCDAEYLPSPEQIWQFMLTNRNAHDYGIEAAVCELLQKKPLANLYLHVAAALSADTNLIINSVLRFISICFGKARVNPFASRHENAVLAARIEPFLTHADDDVLSNAIRALSCLYLAEGNARFVPRLLELYREEEVKDFVLHAIWDALDRYFAQHGYDERVETLCLAVSDHKDYRFRKAAAKVLCYADSMEARLRLLELQHDISLDVKRVVQYTPDGPEEEAMESYLNMLGDMDALRAYADQEEEQRIRDRIPYRDADSDADVG
jgi:hypothetical protein